MHHTAGNTPDFSVAAAHRMARGIQERTTWTATAGWTPASTSRSPVGSHVAEEGRLVEPRRDSTAERRVVEARTPGQNIDRDRDRERGHLHRGRPARTAVELAARDLRAYICAQYGIAPTGLYGHRDFRNTICPGDRLYGMLPRLRRRWPACWGGGFIRTEGDQGELAVAARGRHRAAGGGRLSTCCGTRDALQERGRPASTYTRAAVTEFQVAHRVTTSTASDGFA
ncbi:hypothetical protein HBB16_01145 [Pseudonocardia sp. MCCB 268]|nr:hypothetical protein [Pseudonocardia cytotoxica]